MPRKLRSLPSPTQRRSARTERNAEAPFSQRLRGGGEKGACPTCSPNRLRPRRVPDGGFGGSLGLMETDQGEASEGGVRAHKGKEPPHLPPARPPPLHFVPGSGKQG